MGSNGQPGGRNDKTIVRYDDFVNKMRFDGLYSDLNFVLHDRNGVAHNHKGGYLITDNGYRYWRIFCCPFKVHSDLDYCRWSRWLESVRKDCECFFGRLKIRFKCLLNPIFLHDENDIDAMFLTCCILHNMLLTWDGLDVAYDDPSTWKTVNNEDDVVDDEPFGGISSVLERRAQVSVDKTYMWSGTQDGGNDGSEDAVVPDDDFYTRRIAFVEHFNYHYKRGDIIWLQRSK